MSYADHIFRHTPALRGRIIPPDQSQVRLSYARFAELDQQAAEENWPPGWRMDHGEREANRKAVLKGRLDRDLWIFAYGSLIWDPALYIDEIRLATLEGWQRRFCMRIEGGRGTRDCPGLMAALDEGGRCEGTVVRLCADVVDRETEILWMREMFSGSYRPVFVPVETPQGPVEALAFAMDRDNQRYVPGLCEDESARIIAEASGNLGPNFAYLDDLIRHLDQLGLDDPDMRRLHAKARALAKPG